MSVYNWETSGSAHRKKVKKTGTVVFHADEQVDTSFDRLQKVVTIERPSVLPSSSESGAVSQPTHDLEKSALMTPQTAAILQEKMGFTGLLPCQAQCYRGIFNGRDVILHSRTGSGKTLAYALPIIERHLLLERHNSASGKRNSDARRRTKSSTGDDVSGPFLLIFVFSNELAVQTKAVLQGIYDREDGLQFAVAGFDDLAVMNGGADVLIGTVRTIDEAIRGHRIAAAATAAEEAEAKREQQLLRSHGRRQRIPEAPSQKKSAKTESNAVAAKKQKETAVVELASDGEDGFSDDGSSDDEDAVAGQEAGVVSAAKVRAIVVDEVDATLGPRFSNMGRRMKNLLKFVRRSNGSLTEGLLNDFRAHHYVLCGATIPNWVLKAGFLGVKKYYYQLVTVGTAKLPSTLECFNMVCPIETRVAAAAHLISEQEVVKGRVVVFGTQRQVKSLEELLQRPSSSGVDVAGKAKVKAKSGKKSPGSVPTQQLCVRSLMGAKEELDRIAAIEDFNSGAARVLLCTDLAARGLDFLTVDTVLMMSLPHNALNAETFVHRAGRTARVGRAGRCIVLHDKTEEARMSGISKSVHVVFKSLPPFVVSQSLTETSRTASSTASAIKSSTTTVQLVVRNRFRLTKPDIKVPTAMEMLKKHVQGDLYAAMGNVHEEANSHGEVVVFTVPTDRLHEVKQLLWKYTLKEVA